MTHSAMQGPLFFINFVIMHFGLNRELVRARPGDIDNVGGEDILIVFNA